MLSDAVYRGSANVFSVLVADRTYNTASRGSPGISSCDGSSTDTDQTEVPLQFLLMTRGINNLNIVVVIRSVRHCLHLLRGPLVGHCRQPNRRLFYSERARDEKGGKHRRKKEKRELRSVRVVQGGKKDGSALDFKRRIKQRVNTKC